MQGYAEETDFKADVTYLDPPYNQRSYGANYFVLNFVCQYDANTIPYGKTGLIERNSSDFSSKTKVRKAFETLLSNIHSRYILLSYNNEGLLTEKELREILVQKGSTKLYKIQYNKFKAQKNVDVDFVYEYLWVVDTESDAPFQTIDY
jgi:adenine-specific DNA-methyltransferase